MRSPLATARRRLSGLAAPLERHCAAILLGAVLITIAFNTWLQSAWFTRMWAILLPAVWTVVIVRLLAVRATLPTRVFASCLVLGALLAVFVAPMATRVPNPYGDAGFWYEQFTGMARLGVLVGPIAVVALSGGLYRTLSVADGFLLGFSTGFGFDLAPLLLGADAAPAPLTIAFSPPFQLTVRETVVPGWAYWSGLVLLSVVAAQRFRPLLARIMRLPASRGTVAIPIVVGALVFLWCSTESAALFSRDQREWLVLVAGRNGTLTAFGALVALVGLSWAEVQSIPGEARTWTADLSAVATALARFDIHEALGAAAKMRMREQARLVEAGLANAVDDGKLRRLGRAAAARLQQIEARGISRLTLSRRWSDPVIVNASGWVAFVLAVYLIPKSSYLAPFWSIPLLHVRLGATPLTLFMLGLAILVVTRIVRAMPQAGPPGDAGEIAQFRIEKAVLGLALGIVTLAMFYPPLGALVIHNPAVGITGPLVQPVPPILLLFAVAATGVAASRARDWAREPVEARRRGVVRQALGVAAALILVWIPLALYPQFVVGLHTALGPTLKPVFLALYGAEQDSAAGFGTSNTIALMSALLVTGVAIGTAAGLHGWSRRVEHFLVGADEPIRSAR